MTALTIDTLIGALTVSGLHIRTVATIPPNVEALMCPILFPDPQKWAGENRSTPGVFDSAVAIPVRSNRTLQYYYLHSQLGEGRGIADFYADASGILDALSLQLMRIDQHLTKITSVVVGPLRNISMFGKTWVGATVTVQAQEETIF